MLNVRKYQDAIAIARKALTDALYIIGDRVWPPTDMADTERADANTLRDAINLVDSLSGWDMRPATALTYRVNVELALDWTLPVGQTLSQVLLTIAGEEMKADVILGDEWKVESITVEDDNFVVKMGS